MRFFPQVKIRTKLIIILLSVIIVFSATVALVLNITLRRLLKENIARELRVATHVLKNMVKSNLSASVRNHLRSVVLHSLEIIRYLQKTYSENLAKQLAMSLLLSQRIGKDGYIYCINSRGIIQVHPKKALLGKDLSMHEFIRKQIALKKGYISYKWKNPGEVKFRPKVLYMSYFKKWDWIISVSAYQEEFYHLLDKEDFRRNVLALKFGKSGYSYVVDTKGDVIVHPYVKGNFLETRDSTGKQFFKEMIRKKQGMITYDWKNPGEKNPRKKFVIYHTMEELGWVIASSGYQEEFYHPLTKVSQILWLVVLGVMMLAAILSVWLSTYITTPLLEIIEMFKRGTRGEQGLRLPIESQDEFGMMAWYFNLFMEKEEAFRRLKKVANTDKLTGLLNRRKIQELLRFEYSRFKRYKRPFSIVFCDIDHFKSFNDTYGHDCGDFVLKMLANFFLRIFREQDRVARWGGEEILILLPETEAETALQAAERSRSLLNEKVFDYNELELHITVTFGVAVVKENMTIDELIKKADEALYKGKNEGRNRCVLA